ncbi:MAG TPA: tetratricopeptide repeat protein, partial [Flavobacteriaceae bacterium]|nr:tetratricopeptide repeat protein [Flavobacteriaceae bacterium]
MKKLLFILLLTILFLLNSCNKANNDLEKLSDSEFITLIANNKNPIKGLLKIDSLIDNNTFYKHKLALIYYHKASYLIVLRKHAKSIAYANKSLSLFKEEANELYIGRSYNLLSIDNINLNKETEALKQINIALDIFKKLDNKREEVVALDVLARLYYINKDYDKALDILKRSLKIYSTLDAKENESATYGNIGSIYKEANDYKNAIYYYTQGININKKYNILNSNSLQDLGLLYLKNNNPEKCIDLHMQSLEIQNKTGHLYLQKQIYDVLLDSIKGKTLKPSAIIGRYFNHLPNYMLKRDSIIKLIDKI